MDVNTLDHLLDSHVTQARRYETAQISEKTSLEEFFLDPTAWFRMLLVSWLAPGTLFRAVKYGGSIGLPSVLFVLFNTYYCTALLHADGSDFYTAVVGSFYISLLGYVFWVFMSMWLHQLRKKMEVHPRFKHFIRFAVWNQLIMFWPISLAYLSSFIWHTGDIIIAILICLSLGYSIYGFINVFKPRSLLAPMATLICVISLFSTISVVVGLRGADGLHSGFSSWMDPKVAVPRIEYYYHNGKREFSTLYKRWKSKPGLASNLE